jgi:hypothetical protein
MALQEPEREPVQVGGLKVFRAIKKIPSLLKSAGKKLTSTIKAAVKKKPTVKSTKKLSLMQRLSALKAKVAAKKSAIATKFKSAAKKVVKRVSTAGKQIAKKIATSTRKVKASIDTKIQFVKAKITALKKTAKAKAARIGSDLRARLIGSSLTTRNRKATVLINKLEALKNKRADLLVGTKRGAAADIMVSNAASHGGSVNFMRNTIGRTDNANTGIRMNRENIGILTGRRGFLNESMPREINNRAGWNNGRNTVVGRRYVLRADANRASVNAETARAGAASNLNSMNTNAAARDSLISSTAPVRERRGRRRLDADTANVDALRTDRIRRDAADTAGRRGQERAVHESGRRGAATDAQSHQASINGARGRQSANEANLVNVERSHRDSVTSMQNNADNTVSNVSGRLNDTAAARRKQGDDVTGATELRVRKQGEDSQNAAAITSKNSEVDAARARQNNADTANRADASVVATRNGELGGQIAAEPGLKSSRDSARATAEAVKPVRPASDVTNSTRRTAINDVDIPNRRNRKAGAQQLRDATVSELNSPIGPINRKGINNTELGTISNDRGRRVSNDTLLKGRRDTANSSLLDATGKRDLVSLDIRRKQDRKQGYTQHADQIKNILDSRNAATTAGVSRVSVADVNVSVTSSRVNSSTTGGGNATVHGTTIPRLDLSFLNITDTTTRIRRNGDNIGVLSARRNFLSDGIGRETNNRAGWNNGRNMVAGRRDAARGGANSASVSAETSRVGAASNLTSINSNRTARDSLDNALVPIRERRGRRRRDADAANTDALRTDRIRRDAADTAGRRGQERGLHDSGRRGAAADAQSHQGSINGARGRQAANEANLVNVEGNHRRAIEGLQVDAGNSVAITKGRLDEVGSSRNRLAGEADTMTRARRDMDGESGANAQTTRAKEGDVERARAAEGSAKAQYDADVADIERTRNRLNEVVGSEPGIIADRTRSLNDAEARRPRRSGDEAALSLRRDAVNNVDIPRRRAIRDDADSNVNRVNAEMNGPDGVRNRRAANDAELQRNTNDRNALRNNDVLLRDKLNGEILALERHRVRKGIIEGDIDTKIIKREVYTRHLDRVDNILYAKRLSEGHGLERADVTNTNRQVTAERSIASDNMKKGGKDHADTIPNDNSSGKGVKDKKGDIDALSAENDRVIRRRSELSDNIDLEGRRRRDHDTARKGARDRGSDRRRGADDAAALAEDARVKRDSAADDITTKSRERADADGEIAGKRDKARKHRDDAASAGADAEAHRRARDSADDTSRGRGGDRDSADVNRRGEDGNVGKFADDLSEAKRRKRAADDSLTDVETRNRADMDNMEADVDGSVRRHKGGFDDANDGVNRRRQEADEAITNRRRKDGEDAENAEAIRRKKEEVDSASDGERRAKKQNDDDIVDIDGKRNRLDEEGGKKDGLNDDRNGSLDGAEQHRPRRSDADNNLAERRSKINDEDAPERRRNKQDAEDAKRRAEEDLQRARRDKEGLPSHDDPTRLYEDDSIKKRKKQEQEEYNEALKRRKEDLDADLLQRSNRNHRLMEHMDRITYYISRFTSSTPINPAVFIGPGIQSPGFVYPGTQPGVSGATVPPGNNAPPPGTPTPTGAETGGPPGDTSGDTRYEQGRIQGLAAGEQEGKRDGTADAQQALLKVENETEQTILDKLKRIYSGDMDEINKKVAEATHNAYCKEVQSQGVKQGVDIFTVYPECASYFRNNPLNASGAIQTEAMAAKSGDGASGSASGPNSEDASGPNSEDASGPASETASAPKLSVGGGPYSEDENGIMQFGGAIGIDSIDPTDPFDMGYVNGFREGYKAAYTQAYSLTKAIHTVGKPLTPNPTEGDFEAAVNAAVSGPRAENASGAEESGAQESGAQEGGSLRRARRVYKRGKTLTQHTRLLKRIVGKTIFE